MAGTISLAARREVTAAVAERYWSASRREKGRILDELCGTTGWHRKHAVRVLRARTQPAGESKPRQRRYGPAIKDALVALWEASDRVCGKRLKPMIPALLPALVLHGRLTPTREQRVQLLSVNANTPWYNTTLGLAMLFGRFAYVIPVMAIAGSLAAKRRAAASSGTFPTHGPLFVGLLIGVILILGGLQYFPALALGPIVEHVLMHAGKSFRRRSSWLTARTHRCSNRLLQNRPPSTQSKNLPRPRWSRNPVMFVTAVVAALVTALFIRDELTGQGELLFSGQIAAWLWFTVLFANFAEAVAEGQGKAQVDALRKTRSDTRAKLLLDPTGGKDDLWEPKSAMDLRPKRSCRSMSAYATLCRHRG